MPTLAGVRVDELAIPQGKHWEQSWPITDAAGYPTGWTVRAQIRPSPSSAVVLHEFTVANGGLRLDPSDLIVIATAAVSSAWTWRWGHYDIELVDPSGRPAGIARGPVMVTPETTR